MFSSRVGRDLRPTPLATAVEARRAGDRPFLDLTESNPTRVGLPYPANLLDPLRGRGAYAYQPDPLGLLTARAAVAADLGRSGTVVPADRLVLCASTSEAYSWILKILCGAGDQVLVPRPSYPLFEHLAALELVEIAAYPLEYHGLWSIDLEALRSAVTARTRAVFVVSPNNPTGSMMADEELAVVSGLCAERGLALVGDEVFRDHVLPGSTPGPSVLAQDNALTFALGGLSKSLALPQLKLAWIALGGPAGLVRQARDRLELVADTYLSVNTPVQAAAAALFERAAPVRAHVVERLGKNRDTLQRLCTPACEVLRCDAGWSAIVRVPATRPEEALVVALLDEADVLVHPGYFFDFAQEAYLVCSLLPESGTFERGISRLFNWLTHEHR